MLQATEKIVSLSGMTKSFGAVRALADVDLAVGVGECLGLVGHNGAGKSTLDATCWPARWRRMSGEIRVNGVRAGTRTTGRRRAGANGIRCVFQELSLCPNLTRGGEYPHRSHAACSGFGWKRASRGADPRKAR